MVTRQGAAQAAFLKPPSPFDTRNFLVWQWRKKLRRNHKKFSKPMFGFVIGDSSTDCGFDLPSFAAKVIPNRQAEKKKKCSRILKWMGTTINAQTYNFFRWLSIFSRYKRSKHWTIGLWTHVERSNSRSCLELWHLNSTSEAQTCRRAQGFADWKCENWENSHE